MTTKKSFLYYMYKDLYEAVDALADKTYMGRRPKQTPEEVKTFIVVEIPTNIRNLVAGDITRTPYCYGTMTVFCKANSDGTLDVNKQTNIIQKVLDKFPIAGEHISATRPNVMMDGEDGYGYQATVITFAIRGKKFV